jgi:hypothetical protein
MNDFDTLLQEGNTGFYKSCEVTQLFLQRKADKVLFNFFILAVLEEKPFTNRNHGFLTQGRGLKVNNEYNLGIQRYWLSIDEVKNVFLKLSSQNKWDFDGDEALQLEKIKLLARQFVPSRDGHRLNQVLKNNFHGGSYVLELFNEVKTHFDFLLGRKEDKTAE